MSINADYYRILLNNLIVSGPGIAQTILTDCFNTQSAICSNIVRSSDGSIKFVIEAPFNAGNLVDQGLDVGAHYRLPTTQWGNFRIGVDGTYIQKYNVSEPGFTQHLAGHFDKTFGNFARVRGLATLDWNLGPWTANWTTRYIGRITLGYANAGLGPSGVESSTNPVQLRTRLVRFCITVRSPITTRRLAITSSRSTRSYRWVSTTSSTSNRRCCIRTTCSTPTPTSARTTSSAGSTARASQSSSKNLNQDLQTARLTTARFFFV